jgi:hypothetical protein
MTFTSPLFLIAALAGAIPVILHLIHRRATREVPFPTLRFLRESVERTRRRKVVDDAALLALRVASLVVLAVGLARPMLSNVRAWRGGAASAVAIVLDSSGSMTTRDEADHDRFDAARRAAGLVLDGLTDGDSVALLAPGTAPAPEMGRMLQTQATVRQALAAVGPGAARADLTAAVAQARDLLARSGASRKELYIIGDAQQANWDAAATAPDAGSRASDIATVVVDVRTVPGLNVGLRNLRLESPAPVAGVPVKVRVEVFNPSPVAQKRTVELLLAGVSKGVSPTLELPPGGVSAQEFVVTPETPGVHCGEVRMAETDSLALDDRLAFALAVDRRVPVAVIAPRNGPVAFEEPAFYLERALASAGTGEGAIEVVPIAPEALAGADLSRFDVVFAVNLKAPEGPSADRLRDHVKSGGKLVWVAGADVAPDAYNQMDERAGGGLLPGRLGAVRVPPDEGGAGSWRLAALDPAEPLFGPLAEPSSLSRSVIVLRHVPVEPGEGARALLALDDGQPLLVRRQVGAGAVLWLGAGLRAEWTNLPVKPIFLPLIARLVFGLAGAEADRAPIVAGSPLTVPAVATTTGAVEVEVTAPSGATDRVRIAPGPDGTITLPGTFTPGVYQARVLGGPSNHAITATVVPDPSESVPASVTKAEMLARLGQNTIVCQGEAGLARAMRSIREGTGLGDVFLLALLIGLVAEVFLANRGTAGAEAGAGAAVRADQASAPNGDASEAPIAPAGPAAASSSPNAPEPDLAAFLQNLGTGGGGGGAGAA